MQYESSFQEFQGVQETNICCIQTNIGAIPTFMAFKNQLWVTMHKMFDRRHLRCMKGENNNVFTIIEGCFLLMPRLQYINTIFSPFLL